MTVELPGEPALALIIAARSEPAPELLRLVTTTDRLAAGAAADRNDPEKVRRPEKTYSGQPAVPKPRPGDSPGRGEQSAENYHNASPSRIYFAPEDPRTLSSM